MGIDTDIRQLVRTEVERALVPIRAALDGLHAQTEVIQRLSAVFGGRGVTRRAAAPAARRASGSAGKKRGPRSEGRACAILGCNNAARSKGYCSAHYQKRRNLQKTKRLPSDWKEDAAPGTVKDLVLPRGRRAATPS